MEGASDLSLSLSLSTPGCPPCPKAKEIKEPAGGSEPSCDLALSLALCPHNPKRLCPPAELAEGSQDMTLSLELTLSPPSGKQRRVKSTMSKEESCSTTVEEEVESRKRKTPEKAEAGETFAAVAEGDDPQPPCDLDDTRSTWREKVKSMMGTDITRVMVKRTFPTDISRSHARFLLTDGKEDKKMATEKGAKGPTKLLSLLTEAEKAATNGPQGLPVVLLDRWGLEYQGDKIKYWKSCESYNVVGKWNDFVERNEIDPGDVVEVHLFRVPSEMEPPPPAPTAMSSAPAAEAPAVPSTAPTEDDGGGGREGWRVGLAVCSLVPEEEVVRRRRDSPEARKSRRKQLEDAMKRNRTPRSGKDRVGGG